MKTCIVTFHFVFNYGAQLQCVALKKALESRGCEVRVLDYRPLYHRNQYRVFPDPLIDGVNCFRRHRSQGGPKALAKGAVRFIKTLAGWRHLKYIRQRMRAKKAFAGFPERHMNLTRRYATLRAIRKNPPDCDLLIAGSDQIWNPAITNGALDPVYFLRFGKPDVRRISYAASASQLDPGLFFDELRGLTAGLDDISLRENGIREELSAIAGREVALCVDPTLLLRSDDFREFQEEIQEKPGGFVLLFTLRDDPIRDLIACAARSVSERLGLPVIDVSYEPIRWPMAVADRRGASLGQFLTYIESAAFVVTNSFHGTALSLLYHKEFLTVPGAARGSRMIELLNATGLGDRLIGQNDAVDRAFPAAIDYAAVDERLEALRAGSVGFLERNIEAAKQKNTGENA